MRKTIEHLRTKSENYRKGVALAVSAAFTLVLVGIWGVTIPIRFATIAAKATAQPAAAIAASPIEALRSTLNQNVSDLKNQINGGTSIFATTSAKTQSNNHVSNGVVITDTSSSQTSNPFLGQ